MKTKKILLVIALFISVYVNAQDKYEFMTINYQVFKTTICVSIDGEQMLLEKLEIPKEQNSNLNTNPLLKKVKEYQDKDWELMKFDTYAGGFPSYIAYMRKKKK